MPSKFEAGGDAFWRAEVRKGGCRRGDPTLIYFGLNIHIAIDILPCFAVDNSYLIPSLSFRTKIARGIGLPTYCHKSILQLEPS